MPPTLPTFVSRGGQKLHHALTIFNLDITGFRCADLGCSTGGFTDCLLQHHAAHVTSIDTAYGIFAYPLRTHPNVTILERTNALHATPPQEPENKCDLVVLDMGWTPQRLCIPAALKWLKPTGHIITLIKPHYELTKDQQRKLLHKGILADDVAQRITEKVCAQFPDWGASLLNCAQSPIRGGKKTTQTGNLEWLALLSPAQID